MKPPAGAPWWLRKMELAQDCQPVPRCEMRCLSLAFWAAPEMAAGHLLLAVGVSTYMLIAIRHEEGDLTDLFGDDYRNYRHGVGMLLPRFRRAGDRTTAA